VNSNSAAVQKENSTRNKIARKFYFFLDFQKPLEEDRKSVLPKVYGMVEKCLARVLSTGFLKSMFRNNLWTGR
jgi:hypothetical protein